MSVDSLRRGRSGRTIRADVIGNLLDAADQRVDGASRLLWQQRLELGKRHLDGVHVWALGRQVEDLSLTGGDRLADARHLVSKQVVEHHDVATLEGRGGRPLDVYPEGRAIQRSVEHTGRGKPREPELGDKSHRRPMPEGQVVAVAFAH